MDNLEEILRPLVEKAISGIEKGVDFTIEQAPLLVQEFYNWQIAEAIIFLILSIIGMISPFVAFRLFSSKEEIPWVSEHYRNPYRKTRNRYIHADNLAAVVIVGVFTFIGSASTFCVALVQLFKVIISPRLYLIEYFLN